jgi:glycogen operon protein
MILGGDEIGRTQGGNNNAYAQDNEISWFDWAAADEELLSFTAALVALRRENPALRPEWFRSAPEVDGTDTVVLQRSDGAPFSDDDWDDPEARSITFVFSHEGGDSFALLLNSAANGVEFTLPDAPQSAWQLALSSDPDQSITEGATSAIVTDHSFTLLRSGATS